MLERTCQDCEFRPQDLFNTRRQFIQRLGLGFGALSLTSLVGMGLLPAPEALAAGDDFAPLAPKQPHFTPKAKRIIHIFASGAPSHIDTWDPKPELDKYDEKQMPGEMGGTAFASPFKFNKMGRSGLPVSEVFPLIGQHIDDLAIIRSMWTDIPDHGAATVMMNTGSLRLVKPSVGSWITYGLGTENQNLPGFITIKPTLSHGGAKNWSSAFLPGAYQGTAIGNSGLNVDDIKNEPIEYLLSKHLSPDEQRFELEMLQNINRRHKELHKQDPQLEARIHAFELAFRMQTEAPEAFQVDKESEVTKKLYGLDNPLTADFGWQCLLARRLAERGVRYIQCTHSYKWDQHEDLYNLHNKNAREVDKPIAGLLKDLKSRGLLKDTLVIWAGEFGRTPVSESGDGRDHNPYGYTIWMAGGGTKAGFVYGATDDIGYHAVEARMHIHDFHATVLHLLGLDHERLTYQSSGRNFRLTDVAGVVAKKIIA